MRARHLAAFLPRCHRPPCLCRERSRACDDALEHAIRCSAAATHTALRLRPPAVRTDAAFARNWISKSSLGGASAVELYGVALYIALSCIFAGGSGTVPPSSPTEYYFQSVMVILGSSVWAYVLSSGCGIVCALERESDFDPCPLPLASLNPPCAQGLQPLKARAFESRSVRSPRSIRMACTTGT